MPFHIKITNETIEKLKDKIRPNIMKYLKARILTKTNTSESKKLAKRLRYFGAQEEEISLIISNCKIPKIRESEKKSAHIVPKNESVLGTPKKVNNVLLEISNETINKLKDKISPNIIKYLKARISTKFNTSKSKTLEKKLRSYGAQEEEISLIISNCKISKIGVSEKKSAHIVPKNESVLGTPKKINNVLLGISNGTINKLKDKISYGKIRVLTSMIYITLRKEELKKKLRSLGFQEYEITLIVNNSKVLDKTEFLEFKQIRNRLLMIQEQQKAKQLNKWLALGHKSMDEGKHKEALDYYREAMAIKEGKERLAKKIYQYRNSSVTDVYHLLPTANYKDDT